MTQYQKLINQFLINGYHTEFFSTKVAGKDKVIIRHDIDFDISYAHKISLEEDSLGVKSSFFFLLRSKAYNILEPGNIKKIKSIQSKGHQISIHFDPTLYQNIEDGFLAEKRLFEQEFEVQVEFISIHRPSNYFLNNPDKIANVAHTYSPLFFKTIKYFSDSRGEFLHDHPLDSKAFQDHQSIQLLIHPIWWVTKPNKPLLKLQEFLNSRIEQFESFMADNCLPYREYFDRKGGK